MTDKDMNDAALEALFEHARAAPPQVPQALMARVLADAQQAQVTPRSGLLGWWRALGGAPGLGGLVTATCVGFWLGVAPPAGMPDLADQILVQATVADDITADITSFGWDDSEEG